MIDEIQVTVTFSFNTKDKYRDVSEVKKDVLRKILQGFRLPYGHSEIHEISISVKIGNEIYLKKEKINGN